jgi:hypothetical protein
LQLPKSQKESSSLAAPPSPQKRTLLARLLSWPSANVFLVCFLLGGVLLCGGSFLLHLHDVLAIGPPYFLGPSGQRQVGYLWAPNWSLTYAILGPIALYLMLKALKGTRNALDYLFETDMVRDEDMKPQGKHLSRQAWETGSRTRRFFLFLCAGLVPALLAYPEWYSHNKMRLWAGECKECVPSDFDWGLAAIMKGNPEISKWQNASFDFLAFTCEGLLIGAAILCFLYLLDLDQVLPGPEGRVNKRLMPNLRSSDPRRGFQNFEEPLQLMLNACLTFFLICYSIRVNRIYMRGEGYASIVDFIQGDIILLLKDKHLELNGSSLLSVLFGTPSDPQYQEFFGGIALILISLFSLGVISLTVGNAARVAKANAVEYYEREDCQSLFGLPVEEEKKRAADMTTWPLEWRYFQLDALLAIMGLALASLWYYRIGFYLVLTVIVTLLARFKKSVAG